MSLHSFVGQKLMLQALFKISTLFKVKRKKVRKREISTQDCQSHSIFSKAYFEDLLNANQFTENDLHPSKR